MTDLFDLIEAREAKIEGMERVEKNAKQQWMALMLDLAHQVCRERLQFTADDLMDKYDSINNPDKPVTHELRALGPVMMKAAKAGWCSKANCAPIPSRRKSLHASPRAVWKSNIYD